MYIYGFYVVGAWLSLVCPLFAAGWLAGRCAARWGAPALRGRWRPVGTARFTGEGAPPVDLERNRGGLPPFVCPCNQLILLLPPPLILLHFISATTMFY